VCPDVARALLPAASGHPLQGCRLDTPADVPGWEISRLTRRLVRFHVEFDFQIIPCGRKIRIQPNLFPQRGNRFVEVSERVICGSDICPGLCLIWINLEGLARGVDAVGVPLRLVIEH
jgi:hypothetical protein